MTLTVRPETIDAFERGREQGRQEGLERAARSVEMRGTITEPSWRDFRVAAAAIRALAPSDAVLVPREKLERLRTAIAHVINRPHEHNPIGPFQTVTCEIVTDARDIVDALLADEVEK